MFVMAESLLVDVSISPIGSRVRKQRKIVAGSLLSLQDHKNAFDFFWS